MNEARLNLAIVAGSFLGMPFFGLIAGAQTAVPATSNARKLVRRFQMSGLVGALAFSADGRLLAAASACPEQLDARGRRTHKQSVISLWEVVSGRRIRSFYTPGEVNGLVFTKRTASHLWSAGGVFESFGEAKLWDVRTGTVDAKYRSTPDEHTFYCLAATPDGSEVAVGTYRSTLILDGRTLRLKRKLKGKGESDVHAVNYSPDGRTLLTTVDTFELSNSSSIRVWNPRSGQLLRSLALPEGEDAGKTAFIGKSGKQLLTWDGMVQIRDFSTLKRVRTFTLNPDDESLSSTTVSSSGRFFATGTGNEPGHGPRAVRVWNLKTGKEQLTFKGHRKAIWALSFSADERLLASGDQMGRVNVWSISQFHS